MGNVDIIWDRVYDHIKSISQTQMDFIGNADTKWDSVYDHIKSISQIGK